MARFSDFLDLLDLFFLRGLRTVTSTASSGSLESSSSSSSSSFGGGASKSLRDPIAKLIKSMPFASDCRSLSSSDCFALRIGSAADVPEVAPVETRSFISNFKSLSLIASF